MSNILRTTTKVVDNKYYKQGDYDHNDNLIIILTSFIIVYWIR